MYKVIGPDGKTYTQYTYDNEAEFERMIVEHAEDVFGRNGIYFDIKKKIGMSRKGAAIPDGYYLDLMFHDTPTLYFVEVELNSHDVYGHIGEQVLRFAISSESSKNKIATILTDEIEKDPIKKKKVETFLRESQYKNINDLLNKMVFAAEVPVIIVIDEETPELNMVLSKIKIPSEIIEAQTFVCGNNKIHRFSQFQDDVSADLPTTTDFDELDTIVVPAREDGFQEEFIGNHQWYAIRISPSMVNKIKFIAAYQVAPISAITHVAEVESIVKYKETNKYILYFKEGTTKHIQNIGLGENKKGKAPLSPRYTSFAKLTSAKEIGEIWS